MYDIHTTYMYIPVYTLEPACSRNTVSGVNKVSHASVPHMNGDFPRVYPLISNVGYIYIHTHTHTHTHTELVICKDYSAPTLFPICKLSPIDHYYMHDKYTSLRYEIIKYPRYSHINAARSSGSKYETDDHYHGND